MTWNASTYFIHKPMQDPSATVQASLLVNVSVMKLDSEHQTLFRQ